MVENKKRATYYLPPKLIKDIKKTAKKRDLSASQFMEHLARLVISDEREESVDHGHKFDKGNPHFFSGYD